MKSKLFTLMGILFFMACQGQHKKQSLPEVSDGKLIRIENFTSQFIDSRTIDIWLPPGYQKTDKYAVLYMHDGQMLFDANTTWNGQEWGVDEVLSHLISTNQARKTIVVGIFNNGEKRHPEYFPQKVFAQVPQDYWDGVAKEQDKEVSAIYSIADSYLKFLVQELKPFIDENYATMPEVEQTFVAGSSMGGLISMYALCEYPEVFGGAACLSTHWVGTFNVENNPIPAKFMDYLDTHLPKTNTRKIYFDFGTATLDALYEPFQIQADKIMRQHGWTTDNWQTMKFEGHDHSEDAWKKRLHIPLIFLLK